MPDVWHPSCDATDGLPRTADTLPAVRPSDPKHSDTVTQERDRYRAVANTQSEPAESATSTAADDGAPGGANRRQHVRVQPDASNPLAARLASGADVRLIDLSRSGAQFECDRRFLPNATISLRLLTKDDVVTVTGRVVRSRIVRLATGGLGYVVAVAFNELLKTDLEAVAPAAAAPPRPGAASSPVVAVPETAPPRASTPAVAGATPAADADMTADITAEEALAFESTLEPVPSMTLTASVDRTSEQLRDMFDGNDW